MKFVGSSANNVSDCLSLVECLNAPRILLPEYLFPVHFWQSDILRSLLHPCFPPLFIVIVFIMVDYNRF